MDFDQTWYILLRESGTLLIFKVKGQGHLVKFLGEGIRHALRCPCYKSKLAQILTAATCIE
jgi:hypothetical protein